MKCYCMLIVALAAVVLADENDEKFMKAAEECGKEAGIDKEVWMKAEEGDLKDPKFPEFFFCTFKHMGLMSDNGEYQKDEIVSSLTEKFDEKVAHEIVDACAKESSGNGPENAIHMAKCYYEHVPHH